ncbi:hypothetical protein BJX66DRAFT_317163 [Aspergillus keveii]|uniref:C6 zinc finger domain protein n=1 Tax=Aspergillus keveii TaxID=714993 RepID=A0ABR4FLN4_9EURO
MDELGFCLISIEPWPDEIPRSVQQAMLEHSACPDSAKYWTPGNHVDEWRQFMEHGHTGISTCTRWIRQGPIIHNLTHNLAPRSMGPRVRRAHPCREGLSLWRPVMANLGPVKGWFRVYPASHMLETDDELRNSQIRPVEVWLDAGQILVARGGLWIEEGSGDGLLMWMGASADVIGLHIDQYCPAFIALAHGAKQFLSRRHPSTIEPPHPPGPFELVRRHSGESGYRTNNTLEFLDAIHKSLAQTEAFLEKLQDPTKLILESFSAANNPITDFLAVGHGAHQDRWFLRVVVLRHLTIHARENTKGRWAMPIVRKLYWLEQELGRSGIWLVLMGCFSRLSHLNSERVELVREQMDEVILGKVAEWSWLMDSCTRLYSTLVLPFEVSSWLNRQSVFVEKMNQSA